MVFGFDLRSRQISWKSPARTADCTWHMASAYDGEQLSQVEALASFKTLFFSLHVHRLVSILWFKSLIHCYDR